MAVVPGTFPAKSFTLSRSPSCVCTMCAMMIRFYRPTHTHPPAHTHHDGLALLGHAHAAEIAGLRGGLGDLYLHDLVALRPLARRLGGWWCWIGGQVVCGLSSASPALTSFMRLEALICVVVVKLKWSCGSEHLTHNLILIIVESDVPYLVHRGLDAPVRLHVLCCGVTTRSINRPINERHRTQPVGPPAHRDKSVEDGEAVVTHGRREARLDGVRDLVLGLERLVQVHARERGADHVVHVGADLCEWGLR